MLGFAAVINSPHNKTRAYPTSLVIFSLTLTSHRHCISRQPLFSLRIHTGFQSNYTERILNFTRQEHHKSSLTNLFFSINQLNLKIGRSSKVRWLRKTMFLMSLTSMGQMRTKLNCQYWNWRKLFYETIVFYTLFCLPYFFRYQWRLNETSYTYFFPNCKI